jgi:hypothetical protein
MSDSGESTSTRKVFFLFIPRESEEKIVRRLVALEFEAYALFDDEAKRYLPAIGKITGAVIFAYIREGEENSVWNEFFGELSSASDVTDQIISTWVGGGGYLTLDRERSNAAFPFERVDTSERSSGIVDRIASFLTSVHAKGNRRHLRVPCGESCMASFSIRRLDRNYSGRVLDISSFGMACVFNADIELKIHLFIDDVQLRLSGQSYGIAGSITAKRVIDGRSVYVIVFDFRDDAEAYAAVKDFVHHSLQRNFRAQNI